MSSITYGVPEGVPIINSHIHGAWQPSGKEYKAMKDKHWPVSGEWEVYEQEDQNQNIIHSVIMPYPTPVYEIEEGVFECPALWKFEGGDHPTYEKLIFGDVSFHEPAEKNPYKKVNRWLIDFCKGKPLSPVVLHHPKLDTLDEINELLKKPEVVGLKVHGVATHCTAEDVSSQVCGLLHRYDKPIVAHTDDYDGKLSKESIVRRIQQIQKRNHPLHWLHLNEYKPRPKLFIAHCARGIPYILKLIKEQNKTEFYGRILVGLGPTSLLESEPSNLHEQARGKLLKTTFEHGDLSFLAYSDDRPWNVRKRGDTKLEWTEAQQILAVMKELGYLDYEQRAVFYRNARNFFNLPVPVM